MSRSGYVDDCEDNWSLIRWRGAVASAVRGRRGQAFLRELLAALDAIPTESLIAGDWHDLRGVCALGAVAHRRGVDLSGIDPGGTRVPRAVADALGIPESLAAEVMYKNDESAGYWYQETPEHRWARVRSWVASLVERGRVP